MNVARPLAVAIDAVSRSSEAVLIFNSRVHGVGSCLCEHLGSPIDATFVIGPHFVQFLVLFFVLILYIERQSRHANINFW